MARTTLITWIFLSPAPVRTTSNADFSSSAAAPSPPAGAAGGRHRDRSGGGDAPLLLERVLQLDELEHGHLAELTRRASRYRLPLLLLLLFLRVPRAARFCFCFGFLGGSARSPVRLLRSSSAVPASASGSASAGFGLRQPASSASGSSAGPLSAGLALLLELLDARVDHARPGRGAGAVNRPTIVVSGAARAPDELGAQDVRRRQRRKAS